MIGIVRWSREPAARTRASAAVVFEGLEPRALLAGDTPFVPVTGFIEFVGPVADDAQRPWFGAAPAPGPDVRLLDVPTYTWWYGCTPTAVGMVVGYWDTHGHPDLIPGAADSMTPAVKDVIAGPAHRTAGAENRPVVFGGKYWGHGDWHDSPSYPDHEQNPDSIADYLHTQDSQTKKAYKEEGLRAYLAAEAGADWSVTHTYLSAGLWNEIVKTIDAGKPMVAGVDNDADGKVDHAATIVGYDRAAKKLAWHDTWAAEVQWKPYLPRGAGNAFGVYDVLTINPPAA